MRRAAVVGAGVSGLTCGVVLAENGFDVTLFARETRATTSAVAAAIWYPYHIEPHAKVERWARASYRTFERLARVPGSGVSMVEFHVFGEQLSVPLIETPIYLPWLRRNLRVQRRTIRDLAALARDFDVVVNCAGLGARELCGDTLLQPGRGVVLKTANPGIVRHFATIENGELTYVLSRTSDIVLGGTDDASESRDVPPSSRACRGNSRLKLASVRCAPKCVSSASAARPSSTTTATAAPASRSRGAARATCCGSPGQSLSRRSRAGVLAGRRRGVSPRPAPGRRRSGRRDGGATRHSVGRPAPIHACVPPATLTTSKPSRARRLAAAIER